MQLPMEAFCGGRSSGAYRLAVQRSRPNLGSQCRSSLANSGPLSDRICSWISRTASRLQVFRSLHTPSLPACIRRVALACESCFHRSSSRLQGRSSTRDSSGAVTARFAGQDDDRLRPNHAGSAHIGICLFHTAFF